MAKLLKIGANSLATRNGRLIQDNEADNFCCCGIACFFCNNRRIIGAIVTIEDLGNEVGCTDENCSFLDGVYWVPTNEVALGCSGRITFPGQVCVDAEDYFVSWALGSASVTVSVGTDIFGGSTPFIVQFISTIPDPDDPFDCEVLNGNVPYDSSFTFGGCNGGAATATIEIIFAP